MNSNGFNPAFFKTYITNVDLPNDNFKSTNSSIPTNNDDSYQIMAQPRKSKSFNKSTGNQVNSAQTTIQNGQNAYSKIKNNMNEGLDDISREGTQTQKQSQDLRLASKYQDGIHIEQQQVVINQLEESSQEREHNHNKIEESLKLMRLTSKQAKYQSFDFDLLEKQRKTGMNNTLQKFDGPHMPNVNSSMQSYAFDEKSQKTNLYSKALNRMDLKTRQHYIHSRCGSSNLSFNIKSALRKKQRLNTSYVANKGPEQSDGDIKKPDVVKAMYKLQRSNDRKEVNNYVEAKLDYEGIGKGLGNSSMLAGPLTDSVSLSMQHRSEWMRKEAYYKAQMLQCQNQMKEKDNEIKRLKEQMMVFFCDNQQKIQNKQNEYHSRNEASNQEERSEQLRVPVDIENVHSLYQDLFITDLKQEINDSGKSIEVMRRQLLEQQMENQILKKEIQDLKGILNNYRKIISGEQSQQEQTLQKLQKPRKNQMERPSMGQKRSLTKWERKRQTKREGVTSLINSINAVPNFITDSKESLESSFFQKSLSDTQENPQKSSMNATSLKEQQEFIFNSLKNVLQATSLRQMFLSAKSALKKLLSCSNVHFLLLDKEMGSYFKNEKGLLQDLRLDQDQLDLVILDNPQMSMAVKNNPKSHQNNQQSNDQVKLMFSEVKLVIKGTYKDKYYIWPVSALKKQSHIYLLMQVEHTTINNKKFKYEDRALINLIGMAISNVYERIQYLIKSKEATLRSYTILDTCNYFMINSFNNIVKILLGERNHAKLYSNMVNIFPHLFGYERAGILFKCDKTNTLYTINCEDYDQVKLHDENIVRFPITMGLSGKAVQRNKIIIALNGEKEKYFSSEIDNLYSLPKIENMIFGPISDNQGNIKGVVQLINKLPRPRNKIPSQDELELKALLPALGEIVKTADDTLTITNIATGLELHLTSLNETVNEKTQIFENKGMALISGSVQYMRDLVNELAEKKKKILFGETGDKQLVNDIFKAIANKTKMELQKQMFKQ